MVAMGIMYVVGGLGLLGSGKGQREGEIELITNKGQLNGSYPHQEVSTNTRRDRSAELLHCTHGGIYGVKFPEFRQPCLFSWVTHYLALQLSPLI